MSYVLVELKTDGTECDVYGPFDAEGDAWLHSHKLAITDRDRFRPLEVVELRHPGRDTP